MSWTPSPGAASRSSCEGLERLLAACARRDAASAQSIAESDPQVVGDLRMDGGRFLAAFAGVGNTDGVRLLLDLGIAVDAPFVEGEGYFDVARNSLAIHVAAWRASHATVRLLIERGSPIDAPDGKGRTPLMLAVRACVDSVLDPPPLAGIGEGAARCRRVSARRRVSVRLRRGRRAPEAVRWLMLRRAPSWITLRSRSRLTAEHRKARRDKPLQDHGIRHEIRARPTSRCVRRLLQQWRLTLQPAPSDRASLRSRAPARQRGRSTSPTIAPIVKASSRPMTPITSKPGSASGWRMKRERPQRADHEQRGENADAVPSAGNGHRHDDRSRSRIVDRSGSS